MKNNHKSFGICARELPRLLAAPSDAALIMGCEEFFMVSPATVTPPISSTSSDSLVMDSARQPAADGEAESLPKTAHGVTLRILPRADLIAFAMRSQNWAQIVPYRISFMRHADRPLQKDILARLAKPHRLERIEADFHPLDITVVRAALFELLAEGSVVAPELDFTPLGLDTVFRRPAS
jgi:hypothetical protein